jgi:hypothetical protein
MESEKETLKGGLRCLSPRWAAEGSKEKEALKCGRQR